nr:MAG: ORF1 [TTV-like mini virus]UGV34515.1 MAG: ORF1 [TTV-like mini virus]
MPFYWNRRYYRWRRRRPWYGRPRKTFRRRFPRRKRWVRRNYFFKKKLRKLRITEYQPKSIRKCTVKGLLCLFQTQQNRLSYNFDMYEESWVPEKLPGGGGFSLKNLTLYSLYQEHLHGHNIFTHSNDSYPLMRYTGCKLKFYQSEDTDYIVTYSNQWPLKSTMAMYNTMQPSLHLMQKNKIIVPSKKTKHKRKQYITKFIPPPTQMKNQWYFQQTLSKVPLFMLRTSCCSLDHYYIGSRAQSTNITIYSINTAIIQNRDMGNRNKYWYCRQLGTQTWFLYGTRQWQQDISKIQLKDCIPLTNTQDWQEGKTFAEVYTQESQKDKYNEYLQNKQNLGNPFYNEWLYQTPVIATTNSPNDISEIIKTKYNATFADTQKRTYDWVELTREYRYNPYRDKAMSNTAYFVQIGQNKHGWDNLGPEELTNRNLPLWLLLYGYPDFVKKTNIIHNVDTQYILVLNTVYTEPQEQIIVPISYTFVHSLSPYADTQNDTKPDKTDLTRWFPTYQYQQEAVNDICLTGPGTPKIPPGVTVEAKVKYNFYFKWGGDLPPMSEITDPTEQPIYPIPNNFTQTTSLQNPETAPEHYLYSFDERRGQLTKKATERMQQDYQTKEIPFYPTEHRFSEETTLQAPQEETSSEEEEEENLFQLLNKQRLKQLRLKQRILETLKKLQKS